MNWKYLICFSLALVTQSRCMENSTQSLLGDITSHEENSTSSAPQAEKLIMHHNHYNLPLTIRKTGPQGPILIKRSPKPRRRIKPRPVYGPPKHNNLADPYSNFHNVNPFDQTSHTHTHSHVFEEQVEKLSMKDFEKFKHEFDTDLGIQTLPVNQFDTEPVHLDFKKPKLKYKPKKKRVHTAVSLGKPVETYRVHGKPTENYKLLEEFVEEQFNQQLNKQLQLDAGISRDPFKPSRYLGTLESSREEESPLNKHYHKAHEFNKYPHNHFQKHNSREEESPQQQHYFKPNQITKYPHDNFQKHNSREEESPQHQHYFKPNKYSHDHFQKHKSREEESLQHQHYFKPNKYTKYSHDDFEADDSREEDSLQHQHHSSPYKPTKYSHDEADDSREEDSLQHQHNSSPYKHTKYSHHDFETHEKHVFENQPKHIKHYDTYSDSQDDFDTGTYSFAEPQSPPPQQQQPDIYQNPHNFGSGYFAEPPPSTPSHYNIPLQPSPDLEDLVSKNTYLPPQNTGGVDLPINDKEPPYGYDYPKSSYEVPLYNPNSKMAEIEKQAEMHFYPPDFHDAYQNEAPFHPVEDRPSPIDKGSGSNKIEVTLKRFPQSPVLINPTDLPKPKYHKAPKIKTTTTENYPPSFTATLPTTKKRRYRERTTASTTTKRHNLDTEELRKAFESSTRSYYNRKHNSDESELGQESSNSDQFVLPSNSQEVKDHNSWEPVKVRGGSSSSSRRSVLTKRMNLAPGGDSGDRELKKLQDEFKDIEIISIEKANTRDYYAGTVGPDFEESVFRLPGLKGKKDLHVVSAGIQVGDNTPTRRRGQVFNDNVTSDESSEDIDRSDSLPTNHKL